MKQKTLGRFATETVRRVYGPVKEDDQDTDKQLKNEDIVRIVNAKRKQRSGHLGWMDDQPQRNS